MTRDTFKAQGGAHRLKGGRVWLARRARFVARFRLSSVVLCCALALQPTLIAPGRGKVRAADGSARAARSEGPLTRAGRSLLAAAASVGNIIRPLVIAGGARPAAATAALDSGYEPEPAAAAVVFLGAPTGLAVVSTTDSQVNLSWAPVGGAAGYRVERSPNVLTPFAVVAQPAGNAHTDGGLTRGLTYLYRVRAVDAAGGLSPPSAVAMATAITYADDLIVRNVTTVKAAHVDDLRLAVAGVRRAAALPAAAWGESVSSSVPVRAAHVNELRAELDEAREALGLPTPAYTDPTLLTGVNGTRIRKEHFDELRARAKSGAGVTGSGLTAYDFATARLDPSNRTGAGGVDPLSRNFNWSLPLVSLPGRAGLDLGLSLSYNSLVWTKSGDYVLFDGDRGWPAPGFRLGFPVVQGKFYDSQAQKSAYLMVTPSGARVSLRQTTTPTVYEAGDSSYRQLTENADGSLTLVAPGGTRMSYWFLGGVYKCTEVKDRNGNYITAEYNNYGNLEKVTDTLGRVISFVYFADGYLKEITQIWHREVESGSTTQTLTETHRWAKFDYDDPAVATNFPNLTVFGPANGQTIHALKRVTLADGSHFTFDYTTWGQAHQVSAYAPNGGRLSQISLNLPADASQPQTDCPRPTERRDWAAYWNGDEDGAVAAAEEAVTSYAVPAGATWQNPETGAQESGMLAQVTAADDVVYREYSHASGWDEGLPRLSEVWTAVRREKWTSTAWTQDDESLVYTHNPRVRETNVYDPKPDGTVRNRRRTEVVYTSFGLPGDVREYDSNATTVLRRTHIEYVPESVNAGGAYTAKRIIGLPEKREVYGLEGGQEQLFSKVTYEYDLGGEFLAAPGIDPAAVTQHDEAGYGPGFALRGNLTRTRRWDVTDKENQSKSAASEAGYNTLGSVVFTRDAGGHQVGVSYADSDGGTRLAYPTTITDPDGFTSSTWYNYDTGAVVKTETPKPNVTTDQQGPEVVRFYDVVGRPLKVKSVTDGAFTRWEYGPNGLYAKQITKVDVDKPETFVMTVTDGAGRVRGSLQQLPEGYSAQRVEYDVAGRQVRQYNPVRVSAEAADLWNMAGWQPAAEDAPSNGGTGWVYASTAYDWKGRPLLVTNPGSPATTKQFDYSGCGCAGGEAVTLTDEAGRRQKVYSDAQGRAWKAEVLNWNGSVYSATTTKFNALDQVIRVRHYQGAAPEPEPEAGGVGYQTTTVEYDGHGRPWKRHAPEQDAGRFTVFAYNADDTVESITDARGAKTSYAYDARRLTLSVSYDLSGVIAGQNVQETSNVTFSYDAAGNRISMDDGPGSASYTYDDLSRLRTETRYFDGLTGPFPLTYNYTARGALKEVTDFQGMKIEYRSDDAGRVTDVLGAGTLYDDVSTYASGIQYRAWGALKTLKYGNNLRLSMRYNARLLPEEFKVHERPQPYLDAPIHTQFRYHADGRLLFADSQVWDRFDRAYQYDQAGRLTTSSSGGTANSVVGNPPLPPDEEPYHHTSEYDAWGNLKSRVNWFWSEAENFTTDYDTRNRNTDPAYEYDAEGQLTKDPDMRFTFDAAGRNRGVLTGAGAAVESQWHDGDGQVVKRGTTPTYYLRSSVMGGVVVAELNSSGQKWKGYVYLGGEVLAEQGGGAVRWWHHNALTGSLIKWNKTLTDGEEIESDPEGVNVGVRNPFTPPLGADPDLNPERVNLVPNDPSGRCRLDGVAFDCYRVMKMMAMDAAVVAPVETFATIRFRNPETGEVRRVLGRYYSSGGYSGYLPVGVSNFRGGPAEYTFRFGDGRLAIGELPFQRSGSGAFGFGLGSTAPQNPVQQVHHPIKDADELRALMERALAYGDCENKVKSLIAQVAKNLKWKNDPFTTNVRDVLDRVIADGGLQLDWMPGEKPDMPGEPVSGGAGAATVENLLSARTPTGERHIIGYKRYAAIKVRSTYSDMSPKQLKITLERMSWHYATSGIHEMLHLLGSANSTTGYGEEDYNRAAKELGAGSFDDYLNRHCIPSNLRPNP